MQDNANGGNNDFMKIVKNYTFRLYFILIFFEIAPHVETAEEARARRKRSRWGGGEHDKTFIPGMPTILPPTLSKEQQEAYLSKLSVSACDFNYNKCYVANFIIYLIV